MKLAIGILIYLTGSIAWMFLKTKCEFADQIYFGKENLICLFLSIVIFNLISDTKTKMILFCAIIFFSERLIMNMFFYDYSESPIFAFIIGGSVFISLLTFLIFRK